MRQIKRIGKVTIVLALFIAIAILITFLVKKAIAAPLDTHHTIWKRITDSNSEDAATFAAALALDSNEGNFANKPTDAYHITSYSEVLPVLDPISKGGAWKFIFYGTGDSDDTFNFTMVGWARDNGPAQTICNSNGTCALGTQDVVIEPNGDSIENGYWADTLNVDTTKWGSVRVHNSGNNQICELEVDLAGIEFIKFYRHDVGGGTEASTIGVYGRPY